MIPLPRMGPNFGLGDVQQKITMMCSREVWMRPKARNAWKIFIRVHRNGGVPSPNSAWVVQTSWCSDWGALHILGVIRQMCVECGMGWTQP